MAFHLLYILAFSVLAILAIGSMVRNLISIGFEPHRYSPTHRSSKQVAIPHPEFLDASGSLIREPLLVMRSMTVEDAREQLNALYEASPGSSNLSSDLRDE